MEPHVTLLRFGPALLIAIAPHTSWAQTVELPSPGGPFGLGTTVIHLTDSTRKDLLDSSQPRLITMQLWYPTGRTLGAARAPYITEPKLIDSLLASQYYGQDTALLLSWRGLRTHAELDVPPDSKTRYPLMFFSHGLAVPRANYTALVEALGSRGYVVAVVDHPYGGETIAPDGRRISANNDPADLSDVDTLTQRTVDWARDLSFILDRLPRIESPPVQRVVRTIDFRRVGAAGHSMGGVAALEWCVRDGRARACADLDGFPVTPEGKAWTSIVAQGVTKPSLIMRSEPVYSDSELIAKGRTRESWNRGAVVAAALWDSVAARSRGRFMVVGVRGTGHFSYSDGPFVMPTTITRFGGQIIDPDRGQEIIVAALISFLDSELKGKGPPGFPALAKRYPEFTVAK